MNYLAVVIQSSGKILLICCVTLLLICVSYIFVGKIMERQMNSNAETSLEAAEYAINTVVREYKSVLFGAAVTVKKGVRANWPREEMRSYLREFYNNFSSNKELTSPFYLYGSIHGTFLSGTSWDFPESFYMQRRPWFEAALAKPDEIAIVGPYIDVRTGKFIMTLAICVQPDQAGGDAVVGLDVNLEEYADSVTRLRLGESGYGLLMTSDFMFITHFNKKRIGDYLYNMGPEQARVMEKLKQGSASFVRLESVDSTGLSVIGFYRRMGNGWYLGIMIPEHAYYRDVRYMALILGLISFFLVAVAGYFVIRSSMDKIRAEEESAIKTNFLAKMSHEIRTPLNSVIGMADILNRRVGLGAGSQGIYEYVTIIQQAGMSLLAIINDILDFSKIESGSLKLNEAKYSFISLLNDAINITCVQIAEHKALDFFVHVDVDIPGDLIGDEVRVRQILVNLLSNAVKYTNYGYVMLNVRLERLHDNMVTLSLAVSDTGIGISEEDQRTVFAEFKRVGNRQNQRTEGTGLGLSIVKNLCAMMHGQIRLKSEYGSGSEFTATIQQKAGTRAKLASVTAPESKRVLLFKEQEMQHNSILAALRELGVAHVTTVEQTNDFLREVAADAHDFALTSSRHAQQCFLECERQCLDTCHSQCKRTKMVILAELGNVVAIPGVTCLITPVYCVPLANVLNGVVSAVARAVSQSDYPQFNAPSATVLVVDDVFTNLKVAKELLAYYGVNTETCMDGAEALEMLKSKHYDLVFMDHMMPRMNGLEATLRIRQMGKFDEYFRTLPIVALTANAVVGQKEIFLKHGFNDFLPKPVESQLLDAIMRKWIPREKQRAGSKNFINEAVEPLERNTAGEGVKNLDTAKGIRNVGGNARTYADVLSSCRQDYEFQMERLKNSLVDGEFSAYAIAAHALKGSLLTIGAEWLAACARKLENAAEEENADVLMEETPPFVDDLKALLDSFKQVIAGLNIPQDGPFKAGSAKQETDGLKLEELAAALVAMDIRALNALLAQYQAMPLTPKQRELIGEIEMLVTTFDYEKAVDVINQNLA